VRKHKYPFARLTVLCLVVSSAAVSPQSRPETAVPEALPASVQSVLKSHRAWALPPASVRIIGKSTRGAVTEPIRITTTRNEETLIEYRARRQVFTPLRRFEDDGTKIEFQPAAGGFAELDIAGLYRLAQLAGRGITADAPQSAMLEGSPVQRIHVRSARTELHYRVLTVRDEFDIYVNEAGLLAGVSRDFYPSSPLFHFNLGFVFAEYRETGGVLLPYRIHRYINGQKVETISVDTYELGVPVAPAVFEPRR